MAKAKWALLAIVAVLALAGTGLLSAGFVQAGEGGGGGPTQPIAFPHDLHAGKNHIPCLYCHYSADRSWDAGIPAVATCAGCHIPGQSPSPTATALLRADRPGVKQLQAYWRRGLPIPWQRVYNLPDYVRFPHMRHIKAGLECQQCHGPVQTMKVVKLNQPLHMGWCVSCHRAKGARTDCTICHY